MYIRTSDRYRTCSSCGKKILPGEDFAYWPTEGKGWWVLCVVCADA